IRQLAPNATIFLMNAVYEFDKVRDYQIQMTLPSLNFYYEHIEDLQGIQVHLEFENLLHRSGLKNIDEIKEVLHHHMKDEYKDKICITGLCTNIRYADEFGVLEYHEEHNAWLEIADALID